MDQVERNRLFRQVMWDYNIPVTDIEALFSGKKKQSGHYNRRTLFQKMLESYSWFTLLKIFTPEEIKSLLTNDAINGLRVPSLRKKYEFVKKRLQEVISVTG
jgi:hypothetical protein